MSLNNTISYLTARAAQLPTGESARLEQITVSGGDRFAVSFDATSNETAIWTIPQFPSIYDGTGSLKVTFQCIMASATSGDVDIDVEVEAITPADSLDLDSAISFDTANSTDNTVVPATAGHLFEVTVTLANKDSVAAGDHVRLRITRDAVSDTATGDLRILGAVLYEQATNLDLTGADETYLTKLGVGTTSLTARLNVRESTIGNEVFRLESIATNDDPNFKVYQARVATTGSIETSLWTLSLATSTVYLIEAHIIARRTGGASGTDGDAMIMVKSAGYRRNSSGGPTQMTTWDGILNSTTGTWQIAYDESANTVRLRVTGDATTNITWHATVFVQTLSS